MQLRDAVLFAAAVLMTASCTTRHEGEPASTKIERDTGSAAHKVGKGAYELAQETKEVAQKAGKKLKEATREAKEGWNEAKKDDRSKR